MTPIGPPNSPIAIVLDFPSRADLLTREPLSDYAGKLFWEEAARHGILKSLTYVTYLLDKPPADDDIELFISKRKTCPGPEWRHVNGSWAHPSVAEGVERVRRELEEVRPQVVITLGAGGLWALHGTLAALKWRGSRLSPPQWPFTIVPLLAPRLLSQSPETRHLFQMDLARVKAVYEGTQLPRNYAFTVKPSFEQVITQLICLQAKANECQQRGQKLYLAGDLETRAGNIACMGIAWSPTEAICIPHITTDDEKPFYWTEEEETQILAQYYLLFLNPNIVWLGQNWSYDCQYFHRHWCVIPRNSRDTMIGHHSIFSNMRKGLDFLSAMYAQDHVYWKDEIKEWDASIGEVQYWTYNCLAADTPVLMADSAYKPLGDIEIGDKLFTFTEEPSGHRYARAGKVTTVTKTHRAQKPVSRYLFSDGTFLDATDDHKIFTCDNRSSRSAFGWKEMRELTIGDRVASLGKPWAPLDTKDAGWLSGIFDGEGTVAFLNANKGYAPHPRIGFSQKPGPVLDKAIAILQKQGFSVRTSPKPSATYVDINGGLSEQLRLLGLYQPLRIGKNFHKYSYYEGVGGFGGTGRPTLVSITPLGVREVADITTTEGTFIAGGVFVHNCKDACITWEIWFEIEESAKAKNLQNHFNFQQSLFYPVLRMMNRGIRLDQGSRLLLKNELTSAAVARQAQLNYLVGHELNPKSPAQLSKFFYSDMGIPGVKNLATDSLTTNSAAIVTISEREPLLQPLCKLIVELRSLGVFLSTFIEAQADIDGRMRCSFGIAGTQTYRFSSSENAFYSGMNLQNIPQAEKQKIKDKDYIHLPNIRKLFIPDEGYTFFDIDLDRADLQVVVWEADDTNMKKALREGLDMHCVNACDVFDIKGIPYDELRESHPNYKEHRGRIGESARGKTKAGVHATNYGVGDNKLAQTLGITRDEAARFRSKWFGAHPGIRKWHLRTEEFAAKRGFIETRFGARLYILGRTNLPELLGWLPQCTVAGVINRALVNIDSAHEAGKTSIQLLLQCHDSLGGQFLTSRKDEEMENLKNLAKVVVPYEDPLVIPIGIKTSTASWGDAK